MSKTLKMPRQLRIEYPGANWKLNAYAQPIEPEERSQRNE
jgi:hypothetical protein